ncbi:hypothetical protein Plhal304r1_c078g0164881 [Plasmopara halstedii]
MARCTLCCYVAARLLFHFGQTADLDELLSKTPWTTEVIECTVSDHPVFPIFHGIVANFWTPPHLA